MGILGEVLNWIREWVTERATEGPLERLTALSVVGIPLGGIAAISISIGIHVGSYDLFEASGDRHEVTEKLERMGFRAPIVEHLWIGGVCLRGRHPYQWRTAQEHGTACVGGGLPVAIHGGRWWWPFGKVTPHAAPEARRVSNSLPKPP